MLQKAKVNVEYCGYTIGVHNIDYTQCKVVHMHMYLNIFARDPIVTEVAIRLPDH